MTNTGEGVEETTEKPAAEPVKSIEEISESYYNKRDKQILKSRETLKDTCAILFEAGITRVEIRYDGYGDSGGIEQVAFFKGRKLLKSPEVDSLGLPTSTINKCVYDLETKQHENKDVEYTIESKIEGCAYDFFPCGWEINEGSFGDLVINTEKAKATLKHNTRVESSEYSEMRYDLASEEGPPRPPLISDTV